MQNGLINDDNVVLVDIAELLPDAVIDLKYATADNLTGQPIYREHHCLLHPDAAKALVRSAAVAKLAGFGLKIFDAYRPQQAQACLWTAFPNPEYVVDIRRGSHHSRGVAIDLTLLNEQGEALDMGADFDEMHERSHPFYPDFPPQIQRNRLLLNAVMVAGGYRGITSEWWHFELPDAVSYPLLTDRFGCYPPISAQ
ncbi:D-alanyl-D-alanine dipeptidase [Prodigiosinella confusarubida]|uniref:D-alanyl-D-alanine dipeptidase n=1 Tax=Serratia sp. (strain ATCC 39006) TaxID=104623 RepID=A0A2I5TAA0_SERS3|nr:D-alanyl-D-alanine dipeptidase [Serratia sp. ATCC 39006]AUH01485.1 D-alanyl-D-alanine dipeptidase [Serratia sp. ATCC 39006]AUH05807.1 D-alanyl-D-alanine dipeptidase [Serratia sp. ATCC 39006]